MQVVLNCLFRILLEILSLVCCRSECERFIINTANTGKRHKKDHIAVSPPLSVVTNIIMTGQTVRAVIGTDRQEHRQQKGNNY